MTTKEMIAAYYRGWLDSDRDAARGMVTDDLKFRSPEDDFDTADAFFDACWKYSENFDRMEVLHEVYGEGSGYLVYAIEEDFCCGELLKLRDGKISEIYVTFNATR